MPPRTSPSYANPTQQLDWKRFSSDSWLACFDEQKTILSAITPIVPVTSNFMGFHKHIDYFKFAAREDLVSNDSYPDISQPDWMIQAAMTCDLIRSVGARRPWVLMEQATSQVNCRQRNATKTPGVMRLGSLQAVARGAEGIMFFQWRQSKTGAEKHHSGMLPHAGTDSRTWREVKSLGAKLAQLDEIISSQVQSSVAILMDWNNWWALELDSKPSNDLKLIPQIYSFYKALYERNISVDFVHPSADLSSYKLVIVPNLYLVDAAASANINIYVENGGTLLMSFFSGIVDENEHIHLGGYPAPFRDLLGLLVEEYSPLAEKQTNSIRTNDGQQFRCSLWADVIRTQASEVLATFEEDYYVNCPALTHNRFGKGHAYYLGTELAADGQSWLMELITNAAGVSPVLQNLPAGVEALQRSDGNKSWLFLLNYTGIIQEVRLNQSGQDLITHLQVEGTLQLAPHAVAIIASN